MAKLSGQELVNWACDRKAAELKAEHQARMSALRVASEASQLRSYQGAYAATVQLIEQGATREDCRDALLAHLNAKPDDELIGSLLDGIDDAAAGRPMRETAEVSWLPLILQSESFG